MLVPAILVFALVGAIFAGAYWFSFVRPEALEQRLLQKRLRPLRDEDDEEGERIVERPASSQRPQMDELLSHAGGLVRPLELAIERAGMTVTVPGLIVSCVIAGMVGAIVLGQVSPNPAVAVPVGACFAWLPIAWVRHKAKRRVAQFEEQFPEAIELIARALRAGHAFTTGLALVAEELPDPVGGEFRLVYDRQNFGMPVADALHLFAERVPLLDARFFATAVLTQRESGGNLAEILDNLGSVIRQRFRVRRQIRVVTAHARLTGWILIAMPLVTAMVTLLVSPEHMMTLWRDPLGVRMIMVALGLWVVGLLAIRKLVDVEYDHMALDVLLMLAAVFATTALLSGSMAALVLTRQAPARRRLERMISPRGPAPIVLKTIALTDSVGPALARVSKLLPTSSKEMTRIRRRLARAGYYNYGATVIFAAIEIGLPLVLGLVVFLAMGSRRGIMVAILAAIVGYLLPGLMLGRMVTKRQRQIRNGLPDALDLLIVCIEAGLALDQALLKVSEELALAHPALAEELQTVTNEVRAGKPRMEAFRNLAERTKVDDVRALVAMLIQTDRFGTSIAQALRTHADTARTSRRQHAEERAAKLGVKLVFPLVFCLFPAMYVVTVGPGAIRILRVLIQGIGER